MGDASNQTMEWYKHENQQRDGSVMTRTAAEASKTRLVGPIAQEIGHKLQVGLS